MRYIYFYLCLLFSFGCSEPVDNNNDSKTSIECRLNSDCEVGLVCVDSLCVENEVIEICEGTGCPCSNDSECSTRYVCDLEASQCTALMCLNNTDCILREVCESGLCQVDVEADRDLDGVPDGSPDNPRDNCPQHANPDQEDADGDGQGDECDDDDDDDGVVDDVDNCPLMANRSQYDANQDDVGNTCDPEVEGTTLTGTLLEGDWQLGDISDARVTLTQTEEVAVVNASGRFTFSQALKTSSTYQLVVEWPGYEPLHINGAADLNTEIWDVGRLTLNPQMTRAQVLIEREEETNHEGIRISIMLGDEPLFSLFLPSST